MKAPKRQTQRHGRQGSRTPLEVEQRVLSLYREGWTAARIARELELELEMPPKVRTVRTIIRRHVPRAEATEAPQLWYFADRRMPDDDAALVMGVLAEERRTRDEAELEDLEDLDDSWTRPRHGWQRPGAGFGPDVLQAEWVVRVRRSAPDLPARRVLSLARDFAAAERAGDGPEELARGSVGALIEEELLNFLSGAEEREAQQRARFVASREALAETIAARTEALMARSKEITDDQA